MTQQEITPREALMRLGASTAEAIAKVLEMFAPGTVERGEVTVLADGASPFANVARGSIATSVSYVDGVTGANVFVMTPAGARALATAMGALPEEVAEGAEAPPLSELELSALSESANQTMAAAAAAIGVVLGQEIEISTPNTRVLDDPGAAADIYGTAPHATSTTFMIAGESCRLIQLVPRAFVVRMVHAIDEESAERTDSTVGTRLGRARRPVGPSTRARTASRSRRRSEGSASGCGPSSAVRGCRWGRLWDCPSARSWTSIGPRMRPSTCT